MSLLIPICFAAQNRQNAQSQLSLADILIGLRSKKVTIIERNTLLTEAVKARGITFTLTAQIESELRSTGASDELVEAIRQKSPKPQIVSTPAPIPTPSPTPPDASFYQKRADAAIGKGEYDRAIEDYNEVLRLNPQNAAAYSSRGFAYDYKSDRRKAFESYASAVRLKPELASQPLMQCVSYNSTNSENPDKAIDNCTKALGSTADFALAYYIRGNAYLDKKDYDNAILNYNKTVELNPKYAPVFTNRGLAFHHKQDYILAVADLTKAIELNPNSSKIYGVRGNAFEKQGNLQQAVNDYQKAVELDAANDSAKSSLQRIQAKQVEAAAAKANKLEPPDSIVENVPAQITNVGELVSRAVRMSTPAYPADVRRMGIQGKITVQIEIDEEGDVISAKANSGNGMLRNSAEDAARRSKFKPVLINNKPVKATGFIVYSFTQ